MGYSIFNILLGIIFILIGLEIYKPFKKDKEEEIMRKFKGLYLWGGMGLILWGLVKLLHII
jgi:hypothetical protein